MVLIGYCFLHKTLEYVHNTFTVHSRKTDKSNNKCRISSLVVIGNREAVSSLHFSLKGKGQGTENPIVPLFEPSMVTPIRVLGPQFLGCLLYIRS